MIIFLLIISVACLLGAYWITERSLALRHQQIRARYFRITKEARSRLAKGPTESRLKLQSGRKLEERLVDAGFYSRGIARLYPLLKLAIGLSVLVLACLLPLDMQSRLALVVMGVIGAIVLPDIFLALRTRTIVAKAATSLPYFLDMLAVSIQTGMTMEAAFAHLAQEMKPFDRHLCAHLYRTSQIAKVKNLEFAMKNLQQRLPAPEFSSFVVTVLQNLQYGTAISRILQDLAQDTREMQMLNIEERVGKLAAKMSVPLIVFILMPVVVLILAPSLMQLKMGG